MTEKPTKSEALLARAYALSNDEETRSLYRDWASTYDETMLEGLEYLTPKRTAKLLAGALENKSANVLDVGSGTGLAGENLAQEGFKSIDALDYSNAMLGVAKAREYAGRPVYAKCIQADLNKPLELEDNSYDAMISTGLFTHAHVGANCLPELFRLLKSGGVFAATVHKDIWESGGFEEVTNRLEQAGMLKTKTATLDIFFKADKEPQGYYILWECIK